MGMEPSSSACGSISKAIVASRIPLAKPSAADMNNVLGLCHSAISPPTGEATAAAPAIARIVSRSADTEDLRLYARGCRTPKLRECYPRSPARSEEHTSELQSLMRSSYAVFCLKKKKSNDSKS